MSLAEVTTRRREGRQQDQAPRKTRVSLPRHYEAYRAADDRAGVWRVDSRSEPGVVYIIDCNLITPACTCTGYSYRQRCGHVQAALVAQASAHTADFLARPGGVPEPLRARDVERPAGMAALVEAFHPDPLPPAASPVNTYAPSRNPDTALEQVRAAIEASLSEVVRAERFRNTAAFTAAVDAHRAALDAYTATFEQAAKEAGL